MGDCGIRRDIFLDFNLPRILSSWMINPPRYSLPPRIFRLVSRAEAMSLFANLSRLSITLVKHLIALSYEREREKKRASDKKNGDRETRGGCFGRRRRRRRPSATAFSLFHPRNEPPSEKRPHYRGIRKQNQYTAPPPPETCEQTTLECLASMSFAHPFFDGTTHASQKVGTTGTCLFRVPPF